MSFHIVVVLRFRCTLDGGSVKNLDELYLTSILRLLPIHGLTSSVSL